MGRCATLMILKSSAIVATALILMGCNEVSVQSAWTATPKEIDGARSDWKGIPTTYFEDEGVQLGVCNDAENLFLLIRFTGEQKAGMIAMSGMTIWLGEKGEDNKRFGIRFPAATGRGEMMERFGGGGMMERGEMPPAEQMRGAGLKRLESADEIALLYGTSVPLEIVSADGSGGPSAGFTDADGIYTLEFGIPLSIDYSETIGFTAEPGSMMEIGLEWGFNMGDRMPMRPSGGMGGGRGGMGGMGGGPRGMGGGGDRQPPKKQEIKLKIDLAEERPGNAGEK